MGMSTLEAAAEDTMDRLIEELDWAATVWDRGPEEHELFVFWERWLRQGAAEAVEKGLVY